MLTVLVSDSQGFSVALCICSLKVIWLPILLNWFSREWNPFQLLHVDFPAAPKYIYLWVAKWHQWSFLPFVHLRFFFFFLFFVYSVCCKACGINSLNLEVSTAACSGILYNCSRWKNSYNNVQVQSSYQLSVQVTEREVCVFLGRAGAPCICLFPFGLKM